VLAKLDIWLSDFVQGKFYKNRQRKSIYEEEGI
jgi:hypothetical protein